MKKLLIALASLSLAACAGMGPDPQAIGGFPFTTGPAEASYVITDLVKPNAVIPSHANEVATKGGKVVPGSRTDQFMKRVGMPAHVPLSGKTMTFDGSGKCVAGC